MLFCQGKLVAEKEMTKVLSSAHTKVEGMVGKITQVKAARGVARVAVHTKYPFKYPCRT